MAFFDRREFLSVSAAAAAGVLAHGRVAPVWAQDTRGLPMTPVVQTASGRVRGVVKFGVNQFWGVPYAASTEGANRFMPPVKTAPWTGVRDCVEVGHRAPQDADGRSPRSSRWIVRSRWARTVSISMSSPRVLDQAIVP
jgi:para-nitrobenzyl esterase